MPYERLVVDMVNVSLPMLIGQLILPIITMITYSVNNTRIAISILLVFHRNEFGSQLKKSSVFNRVKWRGIVCITDLPGQVNSETVSLHRLQMISTKKCNCKYV